MCVDRREHRVNLLVAVAQLLAILREAAQGSAREVKSVLGLVLPFDLPEVLLSLLALLL